MNGIDLLANHSFIGPNGPEEPERKKCGYGEHGFKPFQGYRDEPGKPHCLTCGHLWGECNWHWVKGDPPFEEPPLTPEEEEEAPCPHESWEVGSQWRDEETGKRWKSRRCADCRESLDNVLEDEAHDFEGPTEPEVPPQPDRRPPYAVSYSVQGHLFEVALPGDATVRAVDGALVIQHHLGPVLGIVQVLPVINEEGS
jgi:hypothetical protein